MNPMSTTDGQVDQIIGSAYQVIKYVASNMETIINMSGTAAELEEVMAKLQIVYDNMDSILLVSSNIADVNAVGAHLNQIDTIFANITAVINTSNNIAAVNNVDDNMAALLDLHANMNNLVNILAPVKVIVREAIRRSYAEVGYTLVSGSCELGAT